MARIRTIKPEFWEDEVVATLSRDARLLFIATLNMADDEGRLRWTPAYIKSNAFIYDDDLGAREVAALMEELTEASLIRSYTAGKVQARLAVIDGFTKHQKINRPTSSKLPAPPEIRPSEPLTESLTESLSEDSVSQSVSGSVPEGKGTGKGKENPLADADAPTDEGPPPAQDDKPPRAPDLVFEAVAHACGIDIDELTDTGRGPLNRAVKELKAVGATPNDVAQRGASYRRRFPETSLTPTALAKHWSSLGTGPGRPPPAQARRRCPHDCGQDLGAGHDDGVCRSVRPRKAAS